MYVYTYERHTTYFAMADNTEMAISVVLMSVHTHFWLKTLFLRHWLTIYNYVCMYVCMCTSSIDIGQNRSLNFLKDDEHNKT